MSVDGNWNLTMSTPMGDRNATLSLTSAGGALTGTQAADGDSTEIFDGTVNGNDVAWKVSITNPMPLTLAFTAPLTATPSREMGIGPMAAFRLPAPAPKTLHPAMPPRAASRLRTARLQIV